MTMTANCGDLGMFCAPCQALAGTPVDKISLRPSGAERSLISFSFLRKAGATSRRVAFLKTCDGLLKGENSLVLDFFSCKNSFGSRAGFVGVRGFLTIIVSLVGNELVQIA